MSTLHISRPNRTFLNGGISELIQARQRIEQGCCDISQATLTLYAEGINPSAQQVASKLSDPGVMRTPEGLTTWYTARRELGFER